MLPPMATAGVGALDDGGGGAGGFVLLGWRIAALVVETSSRNGPEGW